MSNINIKYGTLQDLSDINKTDGVIYFAQDENYPNNGKLYYDTPNENKDRVDLSGAGYVFDNKGEIFNDYRASTNKEGNVATGAYSHAEGYHTAAQGDYSHSEGSNTTASGDYGSHAEGAGTEASGNWSHSEGYRTVALGKSSHAEGYQTTTFGESGHIEGKSSSNLPSDITNNSSNSDIINKWGTRKFSLAKGNQSHVEGFDNLALGDNSHAEGNGTTALGDNSHTEGQSTTAQGNYSHAEGNRSFSLGTSSHAEGSSSVRVENLIPDISKDTSNDDILTKWNEGIKFSLAKGNHSHIEGFNTLALEDNSHAEGESTIAFGQASHSEGIDSIASGYSSHAEGKSQANGDYSHAEGEGTEVHGEASHAEGYETITQGDYSHTEGRSTIAYGKSSHAEGHKTEAGVVNSLMPSSSHSEGYFTKAAGAASHSEGIGEVAIIQLSPKEGSNDVYTYSDISCSSSSIIEGASVIKKDGQSINIIAINPTEKTIILEKTLGEIENNTWIDIHLSGLATGQSSHSEGMCTIANGYSSHSEGYYTIASGEGSHAEGTRTIAQYGSSHAEGYETEAYFDGSHAEGQNTKAYGYHSHAEGNGTTAEGDYSHAEGNRATASGQAAHAEGGVLNNNGAISYPGTTASGTSAHAEGQGTTASGQSAHAEGNVCQATGYGSHAEGYQTIASGAEAHAEGSQCQATANHSHAGGWGTIADKNDQTVVGKWNTSTGALFAVGNGTSNTARSNAFEVFGSGQLNVAGSSIFKPFAKGQWGQSSWLSGGGQALVLGGGENFTNLITALWNDDATSNCDESIYLAADSGIYFYPNRGNWGTTNDRGMVINTNNVFHPLTGIAGHLGAISYPWESLTIRGAKFYAKEVNSRPTVEICTENGDPVMRIGMQRVGKNVNMQYGVAIRRWDIDLDSNGEGDAWSPPILTNAYTSSHASYSIQAMYCTGGNLYIRRGIPGETYSWYKTSVTLDTSDIRVKKNIQNCSINALSVLNKIQLKEFDKLDTNQHWPIGFIADEVENLDPLLLKPKDEGAPVSMEEQLKEINVFYLQGYLIKGIQELSQENQQLKNTILNLQNQINEIKNQ